LNLDYITYGSSSLILLSFLAVAVATDIHHQRRIPNVLVSVMIGCGIVSQMIFLGGAGAVSAIVGVIAGFLILIPFYALGGMGAGDVKLLAGVGSFLGPWGVAHAGVFTLAFGGVLALAVIFWQRVGMVLAARFLSIPPSVSVDIRAAKIPYSLAIAAGTFAALYGRGA
jgi:prepilin peptidase CpaA